MPASSYYLELLQVVRAFFILFLRGAKMEKIKGNITKHIVADFGTFQLYREDCERAIDQACQELQIDDLKSEGQRPWKAV